MLSLYEQKCVDQPFDDMTVTVSQNTVLRDEIAELIRRSIVVLETRVGSPKDRQHREEFFGLICNFILFTNIFHVQVGCCSYSWLCICLGQAIIQTYLGYSKAVTGVPCVWYYCHYVQRISAREEPTISYAIGEEGRNRLFLNTLKF